ncbi:ATP-binding protein [Dactylosporangium sp. CA-092794]|uniref:PAS domain-containing sensor histidine kinase n=1 Tax=Dactylosporangium sp. CA-092794 TaxID=3239929 RepID=UPI003D926E55
MMVGQLRALFMAICVAGSLAALWGLGGTPGERAAIAAVVATQAWLCIGFRRRGFPAWSWLIEGGALFLAAWASHYAVPAVVLYLWVGARALYGGLPGRALGAGMVTAILAAGVPIAGVGALPTARSVVIALAVLAAAHALAGAARAGDIAAGRARTAAAAGARLAAAATRAEAMQVAVQAAVDMTSDADAMIATVNGPSLRVAARARRRGAAEAASQANSDELWSRIDALPPGVRGVLAGDGPAQLRGADARALAEAVGLRPADRAVLAPLAMEGKVFGLLALVFDRRADDPSGLLTTLADEVALALDNLLLRSRLSVVVENSPDAVILASDAGIVRFVNPAARQLLGRDGVLLTGGDLCTLLSLTDIAEVLPAPGGASRQPVRCRIPTGKAAEWTDVDVMAERVTEHDGSHSLVVYARDVSERERLELELRHAQKLESVGRLAAGIAHEINTPVQFVGDNVRFLRDAFADLQQLCAAYAVLAGAVGAGTDTAGPLREVETVAAGADIDFLLEEVPAAVSQTLEGVARVAKIVQAMKAFGHPGTEEKSEADINQAIVNTLVVANNEVKYVADVELDLADLPPVRCHLSDINQVILNLVVNAAHAIAAADRGRGVIRVSTRVADGQAVIEVADTGTGIPAEIADKVFDPFFTTKEVGTGTGQGLSLVRTLVVERHGGHIGFTTEPGAGTVFTVRMPIVGAAARTAELVEAGR